MFFLNGDQHEKEKRHPRLLEEKERATAAVVGNGGPHQAPATRTGSGAAGESGKTARHLDEIGTPRILATPPRIVGPLRIATASRCQSLSA